MGRPSLQLQRREEILEAAQTIVLEGGLAALTPLSVARRIGLDRSTVHHYFRNRQVLIEGLTTCIVDGYLNELELGAAPGSQAELLDWLFDGGMMLAQFDQLTDELHAASYTDAAVAREVQRLYQELERQCVDWLAAIHPLADAEQVRGVAYALYALLEGTYLLRSVGFDHHHQAASRRAAEVLIGQLRS